MNKALSKNLQNIDRNKSLVYLTEEEISGLRVWEKKWPL